MNKDKRDNEFQVVSKLFYLTLCNEKKDDSINESTTKKIKRQSMMMRVT